VHKRIILAVKKVEFVNDIMPYIILRGCWYHIIVLNIHTPTDDNSDEELDPETPYEDFKEDIFKPTVGNTNLHKIFNNGIQNSKLCHI
jgi:hypothetical protein